MARSPQSAVEAENLDVVRRSLDAWIAGDWDAAFSLADPRMRFDNRTQVPDLEGTYVGREEFVGMLRKILAAWEHYQADPVEFEAGGDQVAVLYRERGRGRHSGIAVDRLIVLVHTLREAKIVHIDASLYDGGDLGEVLKAD